ncbi:TlpA family protein disulfide reductase [Schnuerera sp. xch1]|uniref:TlpA family protein disulfide reductase n=1 Tax=Schnuerera sp. xch1 TaxID=2874283 RepID=UPI001CC0AEDF|nr:TlpA disulfide reductase family protein [Schnuerera sp. xch1]MBZ2174643.1 TlpA family protein disulfide reductase [Schnuerera sp. xch1]
MKRKLLAIMLLLILMISVSACGKAVPENKDNRSDTEIRMQEEYDKKAKGKLKDVKKISFNTTDLKGNEISSDIFKENKITMINVWSTSCKPCINEMPEIQELSEELKDKDVNIIGIVGDTIDADFKEDKQNIALANKIIDAQHISYTNLINNEMLAKDIPVIAYPTTLIVDNAGNSIGEIIIGVKTKEEYKQIILDALSNGE